MEKTLVFFIDAARPDYISPETTPFLHELKKKNQYLDMKSQIGYSTGAHPTIWSGLHQDKHGMFLIYYHNPRSTHFKLTASILRFIPKCLRPYILGVLKLPFYRSVWVKRHAPKWYRKGILDYPPGMPPEIAKYIELGHMEPKHKNTLFTVLDKEKVSWHGQQEVDNKYFGTKPKDCNKFELTNNEVDLFFYYFPDGIGHSFGTKSRQMKEYLKKMDGTIRRVYEDAKKKHKDLNFFIFSDHGMTEITKTVDIQAHLKNLPLKHGKDYLVFLDATMARFWAFNDRAREVLEKELPKIPHTKFFDEKLKKKYHLDFKDRKWFDYLLLLDPGTRPMPDYFVPIKSSIKAYHGYIPEDKDSYGIFITNTFKTNKKEINIVDIFPTMLTALDLPVPKGIDGKSIIAAKTKVRSSSRAGRPASHRGH